MAQKTHNVAISVGEYKPVGSNEKKKLWRYIGTAFTDENGRQSIKLDTLPIDMNGWSGWMVLFPSNRSGGTSGKSSVPAAGISSNQQEFNAMQNQQSGNTGPNLSDPPPNTSGPKLYDDIEDTDWEDQIPF